MYILLITLILTDIIIIFKIKLRLNNYYIVLIIEFELFNKKNLYKN